MGGRGLCCRESRGPTGVAVWQGSTGSVRVWQGEPVGVRLGLGEPVGVRVGQGVKVVYGQGPGGVREGPLP
jgi:hypothetical protein